MFLIFLFLHCDVPNNKLSTEVGWDIFNMHQTSGACAGVCVCDRMHQMEETACREYDGKSMETETTTWSELPNGGKAIVEQILGLEKTN